MVHEKRIGPIQFSTFTSPALADSVPNPVVTNGDETFKWTTKEDMLPYIGYTSN